MRFISIYNLGFLIVAESYNLGFLRVAVDAVY